MSVLNTITGSSVYTNLMSNYGSYTGNDGKIMGFLGNYVPIKPVLWLLLAAALYLMIRDWKEEGVKGIGFPVGLILVLINFLFSGAVATFMLYSAIFALCAFAFMRYKSLSQGGFLGLILLIVGVSWIMFGNVTILPIAGAGMAVVYLVLKQGIRAKERGSRAERKALAKAGYDVTPEEKAISKEHKIEVHIHKEGALGQATESEAAVEERNIEEQIHAAALAASVDNVSKKIKDMDDAELSKEQRDDKILAFAKEVDRHIKEHALEDKEDSDKTATLKKDAKDLARGVGELVRDQKYGNDYRKDTVDAIDSAMKTMKSAAKYGKDILDSEIKLEKQVKVRADIEMNKLRKKISAQESKITALEKETQKSKDPQRGERLKRLHESHDAMKQALSKVEDLKNRIDAVVDKGRKALKIMKNEASKVVALEKEADNFAKSMDKLEKQMDRNIKLMQQAFAKLNDEVDSLDKDAMPEEVAIKAASNISAVFETLKRFIDETIEFNRNDILPFINKNGEILQGCYHIENASDYANKVSVYVTRALKEIAKMAASVGTPKEVKEAEDVERIDDFQEKVSNIADWKSNKIKDDVKKSYGDLKEAIVSVNKQIVYLEKEKSDVDSTEKETLSSLDAALKALTELRRRQFERLKGAASAANSDLSKAAKAERKEKLAA